jgi:addiction module HigA family antidote
MRRIFDDAAGPGYGFGPKENAMPDISEVAQWNVRPIAPGEYLRDLLAYLDLTQEELAAAIDTSRFSVNQIVSGKRTVTPAMALKLSKATRTSVDLWLNLQRNVDLFDAYEDQREVLAAIEPLRDASAVTILPLGSDIELLSHRLIGEAFPALERSAADIRRSHSSSTARLQVVVFAPDGLKHASDTHGIECAESMLRHFCSEAGKLPERLGVPIYHFGFDAAAVVLSDETARVDHLLETAFADIPTVIGYGNFEVKTTISGGIAAAAADNDVLCAAMKAEDLQLNLARYRSGAREHLWSRTFRGR